jgi:hypothetical protein
MPFLVHSFRLTTRRAAVATGLYVLLWQGTAHVLMPHARSAALLGLGGMYLIGLAWIVWAIERAAQRFEKARGQNRTAADVLTGRRPSSTPTSWNPLDPEACYYGRHSQRFRQTLVVLGVYSLAFFLLYWLVPSEAKGRGGVQPYELPEGGGSDQLAGRTVRIQKVIRKKFVINPYSSIVFNVPEIDTVDLKILDATKNQYQAGQAGSFGEGDGPGGEGSGGLGAGKGSGFGFGSGTGTGKVRFIRLRHSDRAWDKNFGVGGDLNMLNQFALAARAPREKVAEQTEYVDFAQLAAFPERSAPPVLFVAGADSFQLSQADKKILRQYLLERNGMIFADNLGGRNFHNQFFAVMREVTGVEEVAIPRDDYIHRRPYNLPSLPIVVAHGGTVPYGWRVDGRWVVYYHPGAISDAWRDDHAGIKREIWEECYRLGVNVLYYAHAERHKWNTSRKP